MELKRYLNSIFKSIETVHMYSDGELFEHVAEHYNYLIERYANWEDSTCAYDDIVRSLCYCAICEFKNGIITPGCLKKGYIVDPITDRVVNTQKDSADGTEN